MSKINNLIGTRIGNIVVKDLIKGIPPRYNTKYLCVCDCGNKIIKWKDAINLAIKNNANSSCGCLQGSHSKGRFNDKIAKSKIGEKHNRLTIIDIEANPTKNNIGAGYKMVCKCDCGNISKQIYADLINEKVVSCGCYGKEQQSITGSNIGLNNSTKAGNKYGWYFIKNGEKIKMRSGYEVMYAIILENNKTEWQYEPKCFKLQDGMRYTPDFYLPKTNEWIEVKGRYKDIDRIKHQIFINQGNKLTLIFIDDIQEQLPYSYAKFKKDWASNHRVADTIIAESGLTNFSTAQNNSKIGVSYGI
jgi:hypothetical protein